MSYLGIEFGSTRIKAVKINKDYSPASSADYVWTSEFKNGIWTYDLSDALAGLKTVINSIDNLNDIECVGISGMMHGYLAFDEEWNLLVPFRTWQNTVTAQAAKELTKLFEFNVPQRWSIAHLYQAVLNNEDHIDRIAHITTLAGYIHYMLTGRNVVGIGEASGIFPIDSDLLDYDKAKMDILERIIAEKGVAWKVRDVLPQVEVAGGNGGTLTKNGAELIDDLLPEGLKFAPPEGDAGTGMVATNAVAPGTGNVSAGTSIFSMVVLEKPLESIYEEIDMVTTPSGKPVAMVHCNNCTNDSNSWVSVLRETINLYDAHPSTEELYTKLYEKSLEGDADCGGIFVCNYMAGEGITHFDEGRPFVIRNAESKFNLANFFRATLYSTMVTLKIGMRILENEKVEIKSLTGHGGLFKTPIVGQKYMAAACKAPVTVMKTSGEGGAYGIALLAAFAAERAENEHLEEYLDKRVFKDIYSVTVQPDIDDMNGFDKYTENYIKLLNVEKTAIENI